MIADSNFNPILHWLFINTSHYPFQGKRVHAYNLHLHEQITDITYDIKSFAIEINPHPLQMKT